MVVEAPANATRIVLGGFTRAISGPLRPNWFVTSPDGRVLPIGNR